MSLHTQSEGEKAAQFKIVCALSGIVETEYETYAVDLNSSAKPILESKEYSIEKLIASRDSSLHSVC